MCLTILKVLSRDDIDDSTGVGQEKFRGSDQR